MVMKIAEHGSFEREGTIRWAESTIDGPSTARYAPLFFFMNAAFESNTFYRSQAGY